MREGNSFSLFTLVGVPHLRSGWGGTPSQVQTGGTPSQVQTGGTPSQVWMGRYTILLTGGTPSKIRTGRVPHGTPSRMGYPLSRPDWMEYPLSIPGGYPGVPHHPRLDGVPPWSKIGWHTPLSRPWTGWGVPQGIGKVSTCYAGGGVPLAFMQEDFLVYFKFSRHNYQLTDLKWQMVKKIANGLDAKL